MARYVYGGNAVRASLENEGKQAVRLYVLKVGRDEDPAVAKAKTLKIKVEVRDKAWFTRLCKNSPHQGLVLELPDFEYASLEALLRRAPARSLLLALDQVEDPHNVGALARSADAAGALGLIIPNDRAALVTPIVEKAASGALSRLPVAKVVNLSRALEQAKEAGFWVYGLASGGGNSLYQEKLEGKVCLVLGAEGKGLRDGVTKHCDKLLHIPMSGGVGSLNVSVAGGIALFEVLRQAGARG